MSLSPRVRAFITVIVAASLFIGVFTYLTGGSEEDFVATGDLGTVRLPSGTHVVFFGDSLTAAGVLPGGYVELVEQALEGDSAGVEVTGSGVVGDRVHHLARRLDDDVLQLAPTIVVVYVGVNDVASVSEGAESAGLANYTAGITDLVTRIQEAGASVVVCTPGLLDETPADQSRENVLLDRYAEAVRAIAAERGAELCDLRQAFKRYLSENNPQDRASGVLTRDGIHLNATGNRFVAREMLDALEAFG